jgi:hypothetical protein
MARPSSARWRVSYVSVTSTQRLLSHPGRIPEFFNIREIAAIKEGE